MFFEDNITQKIDDYASEIVKNKNAENTIILKSHDLFASLKLKIVKNIEITKFPKLQINKNTCIMCGLCAKKCPDNNLEYEENDIKIVDYKNCLHCLLCVHHCPSNSIIFGKLTIGENRYTLKKRDELYVKAKSGVKEKYWTDFAVTRKKWRKNTIKY